MFVKRTLLTFLNGIHRPMAKDVKKPTTRNIIAQRLRQARRSFVPPLTQDQLSGKLALEGVLLDRVAITKIETGLRCVFDFEVRAFASVLKVDASWLLGAEKQNRPIARHTKSKPRDRL